MRCSVIFGVTLRFLVINISLSSPAINTATDCQRCVITYHMLAVLRRRPRWQHLPVAALTQAVKPDIGSESWFLATPPAFDVPVSVNGKFSESAGRITFAMTRSLRVQACAQWWRASGDDVKPSFGTWRDCHPAFQLTKHWDYRSRHQSVDDLIAIGSGALVVLATAGSTNSVRTISAHLLTYGEQPSGVATLERRYGPRRLRDDDHDDDVRGVPVEISPPRLV